MMDLVFDGATAEVLRCFYASQGVFDLDRRVCKLEGCGCLFRGPIGGSFDDPRRREVMVELYSDEEPGSRENALRRWEGYLQRFRDCLAAAGTWKALRQENAPLRAQVNSRLVSVSADFYHPFIRREIPEGPFRICDLIVRVLNLHLGIGDGIVYDGIRAMVEKGELEVVETGEARRSGQ